MRHGLLAAALAAALLAAAPGAATAAIETVGSDLSASATGTVQRPVETVLQQLGVGVPDQGQILAVRVKGCATGGDSRALVTDLRPQGAGAQTVSSTSGAFDVPQCGAGATPDTVTTFAPTDQYVDAGDAIGLALPFSAAFTITAPRADATLGVSSQAGIVNGSTLTPASQPDTELLLQATVGTGADSPAGCTLPASGGGKGGGNGTGPGKGDGPGFSVGASPRISASTGVGSLRFTCAQGCNLDARSSGDRLSIRIRATTIGRLSGKLAPGTPGTLTVRLNRRGRTALSDRPRLHARLVGTLDHRRVDQPLTLVAN